LLNSPSVVQTIAGLPEVDQIAASVERVLDDPLYWFPLRHHSPTAAHLAALAVRERRPKLLFLEAPAGMESLIPHLIDTDTVPPVALYCSFRDDHGQLAERRGLEPGETPLQVASWFPLLSYSPEYVAIRSAVEVGADVVFIDLPPYAQDARVNEEEQAADEQAATTNATLVEGSALYRELAKAAGYRSWDEAWDGLFEINDTSSQMDLETYRRKLSSFCAAARATTSDSALAKQSQLRERFMWRQIHTELARRRLKPEQAMVICGGYHLFLDRDDPVVPPQFPSGTIHHALVPYSYPRTWEHSGYGAGNRAPRYYQRLYEAIGAGAPQQALNEQSIEILHRARLQGERVASADAIAVRHHAVLLAQLRGRSAPILDDLNDALISCCVKGDPATEGAVLTEVISQSLVGNSIGRVTSAAGQLPLVRDYYAQLQALELTEYLQNEQTRPLTLDRRQTLDAERSAFLHRLHQLEIPVAEQEHTNGPLDQSLFKERWSLAWNTEIDAQLIERSLDGDSIQTAAQTAFARALHLAGIDAGATCRLLLSAVAMALPQILELAREACSRAVDEDGRLISLADALTSLRVLQKAMHCDAETERFMDDLIIRAWDRACFAVPEVAAAPRDEHHQVIQALKALAEIALTQDHLDTALFVNSVHTAIEISTMDAIRGAFMAVLVDLRQLEVSVVASELANYAQTSQDQQIRAGDFLHGLLATSTTAVVLGAKDLVEALDCLLAGVEPEVFLTMLPTLRGAIEQLHPRHADAFAAQVARHFGLQPEALTQTLATSAGSHALIAELDSEVAEIMRHWSFQ